MEETEVPLRSPTDIASQMQAFMEFQSKGQVEKKTISTKHVLFIVSGAFTGLTEIIRETTRLPNRSGSWEAGDLRKKCNTCWKGSSRWILSIMGWRLNLSGGYRW